MNNHRTFLQNTSCDTQGGGEVSTLKKKQNMN